MKQEISDKESKSSGSEFDEDDDPDKIEVPGKFQILHLLLYLELNIINMLHHFFSSGGGKDLAAAAAYVLNSHDDNLLKEEIKKEHQEQKWDNIKMGLANNRGI
jgi:hypothetical protein